MSLLRRHARRPDIASVLMQNYRGDLSARVAFEVELRVNNLEKELILGARKDREGWLPSDLGFEMIALEREIDDGTGTEPELADVLAERGGVELDFLKLGRKLGCAQFRGSTVTILVQDKSAYNAVGVAREAEADSGNLGEKLVGRGREDGDRDLSGRSDEKPVVHVERAPVLVRSHRGDLGHPKPEARELVASSSRFTGLRAAREGRSRTAGALVNQHDVERLWTSISKGRRQRRARGG
jgi:hypothetical protein